MWWQSLLQHTSLLQFALILLVSLQAGLYCLCVLMIFWHTERGDIDKAKFYIALLSELKKTFPNLSSLFSKGKGDDDKRKPGGDPGAKGAHSGEN